VSSHPLRSAIALLPLVLPGRALGAELFVAGQVSQNVLAFDADSGSFSGAVASTVEDGFRNPGGIALRPSDGALFVSSRGTGEIWRYDTATGEVVVPAVKTGLMSPNGIDFAASGTSLYFTDAKDINSESADAVKRLDLPGGAVSLIGSTASAEFAGVALNGSDLFAVDTDGGRVVRFPIAGGPGTTVISTLSQPADLTFRSSTRVLVADTGTDRVLEYLNSGGSWVFDRVVLPASAGVGDPCALAIAPGGALSVAGCASNDVVLVDLATLAVTPLVDPGEAGIASPKDLAWSGNTLLVATPVANAVIYFEVAGAPTGVRAQGVTSALDGGFGFSADEARVAIASVAADQVLEHDADSGVLLRTDGGVCGGLFPTDVVYGPDGDLFVTCFGASSVNRVDGATGAALGSFVLGGSGGLFAPRSLAFGPNGNLFVSSASGEILQYDGVSGAFLGAFVDATGNGGGPIDPYGFRFQAGALFVASNFTDSVKVYDAITGAFVATRVATGAGGLDGPTALDFGPDGDLFVASSENDSVRRFDAGTGAFVSVFVASGTGGMDAPGDLAFRGLPEPSGALAFGVLLLAILGRRRRGERVR